MEPNVHEAVLAGQLHDVNNLRRALSQAQRERDAFIGLCARLCEQSSPIAHPASALRETIDECERHLYGHHNL